MIELENVGKRFLDNEVLRDFSLRIGDAQVFGLAGVNGAGKSTLLRLLAGIYRADSGRVLIDGEEVYENEGKKRQIFFLPDDLYYPPFATAEVMARHYKAYYSFDRVMFRRFMEVFGLDGAKPLKSFSKGMKRQLFVCLAFACRPKYLFLDEAFDGLDPAARVVFKRGLVEIMQQNDGTAIISSHSLLDMEDVCDSFGIMGGKKIAHSGSLDDLLTNTYKFQIALPNPITQDQLGFDCLSFSALGRIITVVVQGDKNYFLTQISHLGPVLVDEGRPTLADVLRN